MSQKTPPTYSPPTPPTLASASDLYGQAQSFYQNNGYGGLLSAQQTALTNANNPNYYSTFQPTSFENALANQQFSNIWPQEKAMIENQFANSGMANSPAMASTEANSYGNLASNVGQYLSSQGDARATGAINAGLGISPNSVLGPYVQTGENQSNTQANLNYGYQQSLAQQQYQQAMNKYQSQNALASTIGQISPIGGAIYGGSTGTFGSAASGTLGTMQQAAPLMMMAGMGGFGSGGSASGANGAPSLADSYSNGSSNGYGMPSGSSISNNAMKVF